MADPLRTETAAPGEREEPHPLDFAAHIDDTVAEQYAAEDQCRREGHLVTRPDYCDRCGRPHDGGWRRSLR